jgi:pyruvate kinase
MSESHRFNGNNRTKIVCTLGPATDSTERIRELIDAGMDVVRLNFSHGSHEKHRETISRIRAVADEMRLYVPILQDLSGPKIRTGVVASGSTELVAGQRFVLSARDVPGDANSVSLSYGGLINEVFPNDPLLLADGSLELRVIERRDDELVCEVVVGGELGSHKGINVPTRPLSVPALTAKDRDDLVFGLNEGVDWIALSFVQSPQDVTELRRFIASRGVSVPIMSKIEKGTALTELDGILSESDGVMVARGDLGVEIPMEQVPWVQKTIIRKANALGIPVVTATQMLESMVDHPRPTRAEMTDIANAILDGTDAVMLSGETAVGKYPVEAVRTMQSISDAATAHVELYDALALRGLMPSANITDAISHAACQLALATNADFIVCCTRSGQTARAVAKYRPRMPIIAVSSNERALRGVQLCWGTIPLSIPEPTDTDDMIRQAKSALLASGLGRPSDRIVLVAGTPLHVEGTTNTLKADVL